MLKEERKKKHFSVDGGRKKKFCFHLFWWIFPFSLKLPPYASRYVTALNVLYSNFVFFVG
jgi:hypothetical protein